jgi:hypothetical protein
MAYMRDHDHATRGVRAIASADGSPARQVRRLRMAQATGARDRAMARITRGALGAAPYVVGFVPGATYAAVSTSVDLAPVPPTSYTLQPTDPGRIGAGPAPRPAPAPPISPPSSSGSPGGGASGSGVAMGPPVISPPIPAIPVLDTGDPSPTVAAPDNTMRNVLIAAGAAVGAYFLFIRGRSP